MKWILPILLLTAGWTGCERKPTPPQTVTVTVTKYRPLPDWATAELPVATPADGTVGARVQSHHVRGLTLELANCHRRLLRKIDKGESVTKDECEATDGHPTPP